VSDSVSDSPADALYPRDGSAPSGWGAHCTRPLYGAVTCTNGSVTGWCVTFHGEDVCMPTCEGANYSCPAGEFQEYNEGSECFCVMQ